MKSTHPLITTGLLIALLISSAQGVKPAAKPASPHEALVKKASKAFKPLVETDSKAQINWTQCVVTSTVQVKVEGSGQTAILDARNTAHWEASKNIAATIKSIPLETTAKIAKPQSVEQLAELIDSTYSTDQVQHLPKKAKLQLTLKVPLYGSDGICNLMGIKIAPPKGGVDYLADGQADVIIIDIRQCKFEPALTLRITTADGNTFFSQQTPKGKRKLMPPAAYMYMKRGGKVRSDAQSLIFKPLARTQRLAKTAGSSEKSLAKTAEGTFREPLILNADPNIQSKPGHIVLSQGSQRILMMHSEAKKLLAEGKLLIVTDTVFPTPKRN